MVEPQFNPGRHNQNKILQANLDFVQSGVRECLYCLTDGQVRWIQAMVDYAAWSTRWYSASGEIDRDWILDFKGDLSRRLMMPCGCDDEGQEVRYTADGTYQIFNEDTDAWEDAPEQDPRNGTPQVPPLSGDDGDAKNVRRLTT